MEHVIQDFLGGLLVSNSYKTPTSQVLLDFFLLAAGEAKPRPSTRHPLRKIAGASVTFEEKVGATMV
jgi:hypothetical protein